MYHGVWLGDDLIFHRDSAQTLELLKGSLGQKKEKERKQETQHYSPWFFFILQLILACWIVI